MKLGRLAPKFNPRTLRFRHFLTGELPSPATKVYREYKTPEEAKQMYGNDQYGDCVWAMMANMVILATCHTGQVVIPTLEEVLGAYSAVTGFDPATGANDNGTSVTDALEYMRTTGLGGHKILAWAAIDPRYLMHRQLGCDFFGATLVGVNLPASAQKQFGNSAWEVVPQDFIEGGHAILRPGYGRLGDDYVTWAKWDQKASAAWSQAYVEEEYVVITQDWLDTVTHKTPGGLDLDALNTLLRSLEK